ncbi:MAG: MerR family transcriptional regulator [Actinobacteria bacterium]|nr:MerR family transcriptional regulator [Actinomycetota bacterium]
MEFTAIQASRLTGCSISQVRYWDKIGLVSPGRGTGRARYAFRDLVGLRLVRSLLDAGLSLQRIRKAVEFLVSSGEELAGLRLVSGGDRVFACRSDGEVLDALGGGQLALFLSVDSVAREVEADVRAFTDERQAFVDTLREAEGHSG